VVYILTLFHNRELHLLPAQGMASILVATAVFAGLIVAECTAYSARRRLELVGMALGRAVQVDPGLTALDSSA